jgi:hypothetical protein
MVMPLVAMTLATLNACSGGGYSTPMPMPMSSPTPPPNLQSVSVPSQPFSFPEADLFDGVDNYDLVGTSTPGAVTMFNGHMANTSVLALTVTWRGGTPVSADATTTYYLTNPYAPLGLSGTTNGVAWTATVTGFTPFPATLTVGTSGPLLSANYQDSSGNVIGGLTETYTVTAGGPTALYVSINSASTLNGTSVTSMLSFLVTNTGTMYLTEVQMPVNGTTATFVGV